MKKLITAAACLSLTAANFTASAYETDSSFPQPPTYAECETDYMRTEGGELKAVYCLDVDNDGEDEQVALYETIGEDGFGGGVYFYRIYDIQGDMVTFGGLRTIYGVNQPFIAYDRNTGRYITGRHSQHMAGSTLIYSLGTIDLDIEYNAVFSNTDFFTEPLMYADIQVGFDPEIKGAISHVLDTINPDYKINGGSVGEAKFQDYFENLDFVCGTEYYDVRRESMRYYDSLYISRYWKGDVNCDGKTDASDASFILEHYAETSTGGFGFLSSLGDPLRDGVIDANDASLVLDYYAYTSTGGTDSLYEFMLNR